MRATHEHIGEIVTIRRFHIDRGHYTETGRVVDFLDKDIGTTDEGAPIYKRYVIYADDYGREHSAWEGDVELEEFDPRPGAQASYLRAATGIDYSTALRLTNTD